MKTKNIRFVIIIIFSQFLIIVAYSSVSKRSGLICSVIFLPEKKVLCGQFDQTKTAVFAMVIKKDLMFL